jgi:hypothetical protein
MLNDVELMQWIEHFGRWNVQEFVAKSQDMRDVLTYLRAERALEIVKAMPFVTADTVSFEKRTSVTPIAEGSELYAEDGLKQDATLVIENGAYKG